jgi:hypothetical protein
MSPKIRERTRIRKFWEWFAENEADIFDFEKNQDQIFVQLATEMKRVHPCLTFEFGPKIEGRREFVISADGIKDAFASVISLWAAAPRLPRWHITKFRPPRPPGDISCSGLSVRADEAFFTIEIDNDKAGITLFFKDYDESMKDSYSAVAFLMLDHALGEFDVETRIGFVHVKPLETETPIAKKPIRELPAVFREFQFYMADAELSTVEDA